MSLWYAFEATIWYNCVPAFIWLTSCAVGIVLSDVIFVNVPFGIACPLLKVKYCLISPILNDCPLAIVTVAVLAALAVWYSDFTTGSYVITFVASSVVDEPSR